jgi:ABC-type antimicrobial peptide transport system permease subunit
VPADPDNRPLPELLLLAFGIPVAVLAGVWWTWHDLQANDVLSAHGLRISLLMLTAILVFFGVLRFARLTTESDL